MLLLPMCGSGYEALLEQHVVDLGGHSRAQPRSIRRRRLARQLRHVRGVRLQLFDVLAVGQHYRDPAALPGAKGGKGPGCGAAEGRKECKLLVSVRIPYGHCIGPPYRGRRLTAANVSERSAVDVVFEESVERGLELRPQALRQRLHLRGRERLEGLRDAHVLFDDFQCRHGNRGRGNG